MLWNAFAVAALIAGFLLMVSAMDREKTAQEKREASWLFVLCSLIGISIVCQADAQNLISRPASVACVTLAWLALRLGAMLETWLRSRAPQGITAPTDQPPR